MERAQHTTGPWKIVPIMRGKYRGDIGIAPPHELDPVFCYLAKGRDDIQQANARLIAAAPDLLAEALKQDSVEPCIPGPIDCTDEYRRGWLAALEAAYAHGAGLRAAVAKAIGQSARDLPARNELERESGRRDGE